MRYCLLFAVSVCLLLCGCQNDLASGGYHPAGQIAEVSCNNDRGEIAISYAKELNLLYNDDFSLSYEQDLRLFFSKLQAFAEQQEKSAHHIEKLSGAQLCRAMGPFRLNAEDGYLISLRQ